MVRHFNRAIVTARFEVTGSGPEFWANIAGNPATRLLRARLLIVERRTAAHNNPGGDLPRWKPIFIRQQPVLKPRRNVPSTASPRRKVWIATPRQRAQAALDTIDALAQSLTDAGDVSTDLPLELPADFLLSVVVPIYNEQATVGRIIDTLYSLPLPIEVIAVDDGSTDGTVAELTRLNRRYPALKVCIQEQNCGKGAALRKGFEQATGSYVMVQDADLEYNPHDIPSLLEPLIHGAADVVYGSRFLDCRWQGSSYLHRLGNRVLTWCSNCMTGYSLTDMETCYKVVRRELLQQMELEQDRFGFEVELTAKLAQQKVRIVERPIAYAARDWDEGKKIGWRDGLRALQCIWRYR